MAGATRVTRTGGSARWTLAGAALVLLAPSTASVEGADVDVAAPLFWDFDEHRRVGAAAYRVELDDPGPATSMSAWYHLAFVLGGERLEVHEHSPPTSRGPHSRIATSQDVAWQVAATLTGEGGAVTGGTPDWARPRTGNVDGRSSGLLFALADIDILTPGRIAADLRVAATGAIRSDGVVTAVRHVDAKLAAARLADPDVVFVPTMPTEIADVTPVVSHRGAATPDRAIGDWLNTAGFERAGRTAAIRPGDVAVVIVDDIRQALSWLCGRTQRAATCAISDGAAAVAFSAARTAGATTEPTSRDVGPL